MPDIIVIGGGPAGLSAAITARQRGKSVSVISTARNMSGLYKAREVNNYPALPGVSGAELLCKMTAHAKGVGAELIEGHVSTVMQTGNGFSVGFGTNILSSRRLLIATGIVHDKPIKGEKELLGRGVSYCATCDGMLYREKAVVAVCLAPDAEHEAEFLESIGCAVTRLKSDKLEICGTDCVSSVKAEGEEIACEAVFILRKATAPHLLLPKLELSDGHILTDKNFETSVKGVYAAGDCTGTPYQISKAVGDAQIAVLSAVEFLEI